MRPIKLEMQAFGPYKDMETVDFDSIGRNGMFLIKGPTGSGKTTIFDAMSFALYGSASGTSTEKSGRNDIEEWRCTQADRNTPTEVAFTFTDANGIVWRFIRKSEMKRTKLSESYEYGTVDEDGLFIPYSQNPKKDEMTKKAEELVGLTRDQFRQVVMLPQGQFERFLVAASGEKEEILKKIFSSEKWGAYAEKFYADAAQRVNDLAAEKREIDIKLGEEDAEDIDALARKIENAKSEKADTEKEMAEYNAVEKQKQLNDDMQLAERFRPLHEAEKEKRKLALKKTTFDDKQTELDNAKKAESVRVPMNEYETAKKEKQGRENELQNLLNKTPSAKARVSKAVTEKNAHDENSPVARNQTKIGEYQSKEEAYRNIDTLRAEYRRRSDALKAAAASKTKADARYEAANGDAAEKMRAYNDARAAARNYRTRYYSDIYGDIAKDLAEGMPCPVCGAVHHPNPAKFCEDSVTKRDVEKKEKTAETAKKKWNAAEETRKECEGARADAGKAFADAQAAETKADADYKNAKGSLIAGIDSYAALANEIGRLKTENDSYNEMTVTLTDRLNIANNALSTLNANIETAENEDKSAGARLAEKTEILKKALADAGMSLTEARQNLRDSDSVSVLEREIAAYHANVKTNEDNIAKKQAELSGLKEPDTSLFDGRQAEIRAKQNEFTARIKECDGTVSRLGVKLSELEVKDRHYKENIDEAEDDLKFAKRLRGDTGIGLQRYVLAVMFDQVIFQANEMLKKVHGGRYTLIRTDESSKGNKAGLELRVFDSRSPENENGRNVSMLSGGEKFLVSLALSIGMSEVARRSGVRTEALFIDEGFGTLDENSIADAMDVLDSVRKSDGMIGIISHVSLLEENIPDQLEVIKTESGSHIKTV